MSTTTAAPEPAISARAITMRGPWGPVYGPIDLDIDAGGVTVLVYPAGSACTALLMSLAGRMRPASGNLTVFGRSRARDIFTHAAMAGIDHLDSVAESVTVRDLITEKLRWDANWYKLIRRADEAERERVCGPVFGDLPLPSLSDYVEELDELAALLLRIALANTARPPLLVVGNLEQVTSDRNRDLLISRLIELGHDQTVVTASANGVVGHALRAQLTVDSTLPAELAGPHGVGA